MTVVVLYLEQLIQKLKVFGGPFGGEEQNREEGEMAQKKLEGRNGEKGREERSYICHRANQGGN